MSAKIKPKSAAAKPSKPSKDTVYIDVDDEITAIIDKVEVAKQKIVALVLPKRTAALQSIVNMRLLKRSADSSGKSVVLITSENALLPLAGAAGIHVAKNLQSKPEIPPSPRGGIPAPAGVEEAAEGTEEELPNKIDYQRPVGELAAAEEAESIDLDDEATPAEPAKAAKHAKNKKLKVPNFNRFRLLLGLGVFGFAGLIFFIVLALTVLPRAKITIATTSSPIAANFTLTATDKATALDEEKGIIPAALKTKDQATAQQVQATGQKNLGEKATGSITMTAQRCAPSIGTPNSVSAGTGVTASGNSYITQATASFSVDSTTPSCVNYKSNTVGITAQAAGTKYNISNATFAVSGRSDVSASGSASGGTDNNVTIVSQSDVDNVKAKITGQNIEDFSKEFESGLSKEGFYAISATHKSTEVIATASPAVGEQASTSSVTVKVTHTVLVVGKKELSQAVTNQLNKSIDKSKEKISDKNVLDNLSVSVQSQSSPTVASLNISKETTAVPVIDEAAIKKQVGGKKRNEIRSMISAYRGVQSVDVHMSPFWVSHAPKSPGKITIIMQQVKAGD